MPVKPDVTVVEALPEHDQLIGMNMRSADAEEVWASSMMTPIQAVRESRRVSTHVWTGMINDEPACMFGVASACLVSGYGVPWLLGTDVIEKYSFAFIRQCRPYMELMQGVYPRLTNYVDDRNTVSRRWLKWLGFQIEEPAPYGPFHKPFRKFEMRRELECAIQS